VFTALAMEATDEGGLPIVGAKLPGRAATDEASAWFGNVVEMGRSLDDAGREHFTLYLRPFTDPQNRRHLLKTSASPTGLRDKLIDPIEQPWTQANLGLVFEQLDEDLRRALAEKPIAGAPGIAATPTDYGDPFQLLPAAQAPAASSELPPMTPVAPAPLATVPPPPAAGVPVTVTARKRVRVETSPTPPTTPPPTTPTTTPTTPTTTTPAVEAPVQITAGGPPPPPGMKPPAKAPGA
jgi:hypothetical protein